MFLYGTLRNPVHLAIVLGRDDARVEPALLRDHAVWWDRHARFPVIAEAQGQAAPGLLLHLEGGDLERLDFYELAFCYRRCPVSAEVDRGKVRADCYFPDDPGLASEALWSLEEWDDRIGPVALPAAEEVMSYFGKVSPEELARRYPMILARSWSRQLAAAEAAPSRLRTGPGRSTVDLRSRSRRHAGFFALDEVRVAHPAFAGGDLEVTREVFLGVDAALVLPYDPERDLVMLIEQFRSGPFLRGDAQPWMLEPVAGLVDPGEAPEDCARREAAEEAGIAIDRLVPVMRGYPSPGATSEHYHLFVGICALDRAASARASGGVEAEGEDIRTHVLPLDEALSLVGAGEANVVPLALLLFWTAARREELRRLA